MPTFTLFLKKHSKIHGFIAATAVAYKRKKVGQNHNFMYQMK